MEYVIDKHMGQELKEVSWKIWQIMHDFGLFPLPCHSLPECVCMPCALILIHSIAAATNWGLVQRDAACVHPPQTAGLVRLPVARDTTNQDRLEGLEQAEDFFL